MTDIILKVDFTNEVLTTNFENIKQEVQNEVNKYSINVTEDNIPEAKKVMANFNKVKKEIDIKYKEFIDRFSIPINQLKDEKKQIALIIDNGRQSIADNVADFENKKLEVIKQTVQAYINTQCQEKSINTELINVYEFVKLTAVTPSGSIAKTTKEAIDNKIAIIENEILKAKLEAEEKARRDREIAEQAKAKAEERARQREIELREILEREKQEAIQRAKIEEQKRLEREKQEAIQETVKQAPIKAEDGKVIYIIRADFNVKANANADRNILLGKVKDLLGKAGITEFVNLEVLNA
ncbi:putative DUF1351 domain protein [Campylobacter pinnipediorum subsp. pinnipediorum]|uniref:DUF1351 domain-containing protein n=1 Tax=Campylobacter pinnipediorum TaxID=1965231 RepID=UPI000994FFA9|nr:DUF1351 domain-containing protein [Campylobacter pinnipediorum]AQW81394.1 putative DUF1351 domain protein [Campylobacter pinnipediorum subsp. pinnipediorum]